MKPSATPTAPQLVDAGDGYSALMPSKRQMRMARELGEKLKRERAATPRRTSVVRLATPVVIGIDVPVTDDSSGSDDSSVSRGGDSGDSDDEPEPPRLTRPRGRASRRARGDAR